MRNLTQALQTLFGIRNSRRSSTRRNMNRRSCPNLEFLEQRSLLSGLAISDVTVRESAASLGVLDPSGAANIGLNGTRGMTFDSHGDLFVAGWLSNSVARFDLASQTYRPFIASGSGGLNSPFRVGIGPDGNVYVSGVDQQNNLASAIFRYDGNTGAPLPAPGRSGAVYVEDDPSTPNVDESGGFGTNVGGFDFGADGNLYVANAKPSAHDVLRFQGPGGTSPGAFMDVFISISNMTNGPNQVVFGPDGNLYANAGTLSGGDVIDRFDGVTGAPIGNGVFVAPNSGGLQASRQMLFDPQGNYLYVNRARSNGTGEVLRYQGPNGPNPGSFVDTYITSGQTGLTMNIGLAMDPAGLLYVSERDTANVTRFAPTAQATLTVSLGAAQTSSVSVNYATANGTATAGNDYASTSGTLTFAPGETTRTIAVPIIDDLVGEPTETLQVNLSGAVNATIADSQGIVSIIDNETKFYVCDSSTSGNTLTFEYSSGGSSEEINLTNGTGSASDNDTAPRGMATTAAGTTVWVADANKTVYVYNNAGILRGSWTPAGLSSYAQIEGIATNGTDVWILDNYSDKVYKYAGAASLLSGTQNPASSFKLSGSNSNGKGIVTDGTSLWVVDDGSSSDKVYKYTVTGTAKGSWTIDSANSHPTGLTIDPTNVSDIWIVDNGTDKVYQYTAAASRTSGSQTAAATFALAPGNTNPQDIADPPVPGSQLTTETSIVSAPAAGSASSAIFASSGLSVPVSLPKSFTTELALQDTSLSVLVTTSNGALDRNGLSSGLGQSKTSARKPLSSSLSHMDPLVFSDSASETNLDALFVDWNSDPLQLLLSAAR